MGRWITLEKFLERPAHPAMHQGFEPSSDSFDNLETVRNVKVLCIGAGGLGCELLKDLAYMGFQNIHVIDMDTIDVSNLNRQFLFRLRDVGQSKAETAAKFINGRVPGCTVVPHHCRIEDKDEDFYRSFNVIICGLDSVQARRWINAMICSLLEFDDEGNLDPSTIIPIIDGGTEGFKGNMRLIIPGMTACVECTLDLYPPQVNFPMCTIAHTPRLPEHCIEYVRVLLWPKESPFQDAEIDGDDTDHIQWIFEKSLERAKEFKISGVTYRLTQGVVKRIIPAVASTNACIAALCAQEAFKMATDCSLRLSNYLNFQDTDGISTNVVWLEKREDCPVCSRKPQTLTVDPKYKLSDLIKHLQESPDFQLRSPGIYLGSLPLYVPSIPSLEQHTRPNLKRLLSELGISSGTTLVVADVTKPNPIELIVSYSSVKNITDADNVELNSSVTGSNGESASMETL